MRRSARGRQRIDTIFVLVVFVVFAASVLMVLMLGGGIYQNTMELSQKGYDDRTSLSYIWSKVKNSDNAGSIFLDEYEGETVLVFEELFNDRLYRTLIYYYDGWLCEYFSMASLFFGFDGGQQMLKTPEIVFEDAGDGLILVTVGQDRLYIYPRQ